MYSGKENLVCAKVIDADGNGVGGLTVHFTTDDAQHIDVTSDSDGYAYALLDGPNSPVNTLEVTATVGNEDDIRTFTMVDFYPAKPQGLYLIEQNFQIVSKEQQVAQTIKLLLLDENGDPVQVAGTYTVWCENNSGVITSTPISTNSSGIASFSYTPAYTGQYVATFTIGGHTQYAGWCLVDRL
jgi:hypothetical protein